MDPKPFSELVRTRLLALLSASGTSTARLSASLGRSHQYVGRKLIPKRPGEGREITTIEIDAMLGALGVDGDMLMKPVFGTGDLLLFGWLRRQFAAQTPATLPEATKLFAGATRGVERLESQGYLRCDSDGLITITDEGLILNP